MSVANEMGSKLTASGAKETRQTKHQKAKNKNQQIYKQSTSIIRGGTEKKKIKRDKQKARCCSRTTFINEIQ